MLAVFVKVGNMALVHGKGEWPWEQISDVLDLITVLGNMESSNAKK